MSLHVCAAATPAPQQGWFSPPQIMHVPTRPTPPPTQNLPARQLLRLQHGWSVPPHAEHFVMSVMRQDDCDAVQVLESQQGSLTLPHDMPPWFMQEPVVHMPGKPEISGSPGIGFGKEPQVVPFGRHRKLTQHPPSAQTLAGPHGVSSADGAPPPAPPAPPPVPGESPQPAGESASSMQLATHWLSTWESSTDGCWVRKAGGIVLFAIRWRT